MGRRGLEGHVDMRNAAGTYCTAPRTFFIAASYGEAIERLWSTLMPVGIGATDRFLGAVRNLGANYVLSTASFPLYLINYCEKKGIDAPDFGIRGFMVGGEPGGD